MPSRRPFFVALAAAVLLPLTVFPFNRVAAGHSVAEAWSKYQEACADASIKADRLNELRDRYTQLVIAGLPALPLGTEFMPPANVGQGLPWDAEAENNPSLWSTDLPGLELPIGIPQRPLQRDYADTEDEAYDAALRYANEFGQLRVAAGVHNLELEPERHPAPGGPPPSRHQTTSERLDAIDDTLNRISAAESDLHTAREHCDEARQHYQTLQNQEVTEFVSAGPQPDPTAVSTPGTRQATGTSGSKPPRRTRSTAPVRTTSKPPPRQRSEHRDPASNIANSLIQFGLGYAISRGTRRGSSGGGRPSGGGGGGGGSSCAGGRC